MQIWVTKIVNHHGTYLQTAIWLPAQKPVSECDIIDQFISTFVEWSKQCAILDAVRGLRIIRNRTENLH